MAAMLVIAIAVMLLYSGPISDIDTWWHLATGKQIVQQRALLDADPFSLHGDEVSGQRGIILNGYWIGSVTFYLSHLLLGDYGLIALRIALFLACFLVMHGLSLRMNASMLPSALMLVMAVIVCSDFTGMRPQIFSFLFATLCVFTLELIHGDLEKNRPGWSHLGWSHLIPLPLIMILWANFHRGFMIGTVIIALYAAAELITSIAKRRRPDMASYLYLAILLLSALSTLINPNTYKPYVELVLLEGSVLQSKTSEYISPLTLLTKYKMYLPAYWLYLAACLYIVTRVNVRIALRHFLLITFMCAISLSAFRYIPFLVLTTGPIIAHYLSLESSGARYLRSSLATITALAALTVFSINLAPERLGRSLESAVDSRAFPMAAAEFIIKNKPAGNLFNHFNWGGYLIWRLHPDYKVFIDGRALNEGMFHAYTRILWDASSAEALLGRYDVNTVIIPEKNPLTGERYVLPGVLGASPSWTLVYMDDVALVYTRRR